MAEYIERKKVLQKVRYICKTYGLHNSIIEKLKKAMEDSTAADVVEVVRCKDCAVPHNKWLGCPNLNGLIPPPDFYCAKGERKGAKMDGKGEGE